MEPEGKAGSGSVDVADPAASAAAAAEDGALRNDDDQDDADERSDRRETDAEMSKIEKEKENMTPVEKLERAILWKAEGNDFFKKNEVFKAADAYYHAILYSRDLTQNPQYYPNLKHTNEQRQMAKDLCESVFSNLALVQARHVDNLHHLDHSK